MSSACNVTPKQMATYQTYARRRWKSQQDALNRRKIRAWDVAQEAATLLKEKYGAGKVVLFGSLARDDPFHHRSDVDLAAWNIEEKIYYSVVSKLLDIDPTIDVDLVRAEDAPSTLLETIHQEGIPL